MIRGRPINLWLGLVTALFGAIGVTAITLGADPAVVGTLIASYTGVAGAGIALVANQPPVVNPGDTVKIQTPGNAANAEISAHIPPLQPGAGNNP